MDLDKQRESYLKGYDEGYEAGYHAALQSIRGALQLQKMGFEDCQIVEKTGLPPALVHEIL